MVSPRISPKGQPECPLRAYWNSKDFIADYKSSLNYHFFLISNLTGLDSEGIYRISGFADDIESLKNSFDKGKVQDSDRV